MPKFGDVMNQGERLFCLDGLCAIAREGLPAFRHELETALLVEHPGPILPVLRMLARCTAAQTPQELLRGVRREPKETSKALFRLISDALVDWDEPLRMSNSWFDRVVKAAEKPTRAQRMVAMKEFDEETKALETQVMDLKKMALSLLSGTTPRALVSRQLGKIFVAQLPSACHHVANAADRGQMNFDLTRVALALAGYRADHGAYPKRLSELSPKYLAAVPKDVFAADADLHYEAEDGGYVLYSVGLNGKDDGGRSRADWNEDTPPGTNWDDLVIRTPETKTAK